MTLIYIISIIALVIQICSFTVAVGKCLTVKKHKMLAKEEKITFY